MTTLSNVLWGALALGLVTGMRSTLAPTMTSRALAAQDDIDEADEPARTLASHRAQQFLLPMATGELLGDKKARGAFGEVQLEALVRNALPPDSFEFQATLSTGVRVDCLLRLPEPTGRVAVDAKFPLENYHRMFDRDSPEPERRLAQGAFRADVRRHVDDIAGKYLIPPNCMPITRR